MGSCMSGNGTINVKRYPNPRRGTNRSVTCFTSLCKGEDNLLHDNKNSSEIVPNPNIKSTFSIHYNNDQLNIDINTFIEKYKTQIKIEKINFVQIYNIFMNYKYNFTRSEFILCDIRNDLKEKSQALFLKHFPQINYNIKELEIISKNRLIKFFKFINNKKIIFILKDSKEENSIDTIEKFLIFFLANSNNCKIDTIYILNQYITKFDENNLKKEIKNNKENENKINYNEYLSYFIDEDLLYEYSPKILIDLSDIKSSNLNYNDEIINNSYLFYTIFPHNENKESNNKKTQININSKFDANYLSNKTTEETDIYLNFIYKFNIIYIINFIFTEEFENCINKKTSKYIWHSETKINKIVNGDSKKLIKQKNILIPKNMEFIEYYKVIRNEFIPLLEEVYDQILDNNCVLIQFDDKIDYIFLMKFIYIIIFKTTGLSFDNIFSYLKINLFDINQESLINEKKEEFMKLLV